MGPESPDHSESLGGSRGGDTGPAGAYGRPGKDGPDTTDDAVTPAAGFRCDLCGAPMIDRHCKLACAQCGYIRDCSDP